MVHTSHLENISKQSINIEELIIEKFLVSYKNNFEDEKLRAEVDTMLKIYLRASNFASKNS